MFHAQKPKATELHNLDITSFINNLILHQIFMAKNYYFYN